MNIVDAPTNICHDVTDETDGELIEELLVPDDDPPDFLLMLRAYLDESNHNSDGNMFIAGHVGRKDQWKELATRWRVALGQRKYLHMSALRWNHPRTKRLLERLGPLPTDCGLTRVVGGVKYSDYANLIAPDERSALKGYYFALTGLVTNLIRWIPDDEKVGLVFEAQPQYSDMAHLILSDLAETLLNSKGRQKVSAWTFVPKASTILLDQADYLANALFHLYEDEHSQKTDWCRPILGDMNGVGAILTQRQIRSIMDSGRRYDKGNLGIK